MAMEFTTYRANLGSEQSFRHEVQNPANNSKRVLLPLERDFSNMSDPSIIIEPPDNNWRSDLDFHRLPSLDVFPGGISLEVNISPRRGGDVDRLLRPPLLGLHLQTLAKEAESKKDPNILIRREEDIHLLLSHYLIISPMIMADTKEIDIVRRLYRIRVCYSLWK